MIPFNRPPTTGEELRYIEEALGQGKLSGDGPFHERCHQWFEDQLGCSRAFLTPSCTHALELAALLIDVKPGDEIIMPSYTFVSTANAFVLRGARIVFVDIRPDTMNIDETLIEQAITEKTRAIVPVHYAGVGCDMDAIMELANRYELYVIEDAAQGMMARYRDRPLGTMGHLGAFSFHETKNYTSGGEGGLLIINDESFVKRAEIIREKGTNRSQFFRGMVDKYSWVGLGSSYLPSELQAAYLWGQLTRAEQIRENRLAIWNGYHKALRPLISTGVVDGPELPKATAHNAHMYFMKVRDLEQRSALIEHFKQSGVMAVFHYVPLHSTPFGLTVGDFCGEDRYTSRESERLLRLPIWYGMSSEAQEHVIQSLLAFFD
ncbi:dTDP-4-amino-4,6-dideoxygalactose transaminase [Marinobacter sp. F3R11]|uniref:dTDP-4-amino-4,6-dideoxygalactose transaminase n=1 Tax=Marinobacter sp. F3R11 TaxID=2267231 RepID=UPI000DEA2AC4|nr:dTDP-4-amino-4,6-dideoxygalactose transaminase [Marinobacter sp. F3R11]RBW48131.1 dTDP-4-amino-4,6-dideoxygalactose transaminase [Marinobacter sp. F3R11]